MGVQTGGESPALFWNNRYHSYSADGYNDENASYVMDITKGYGPETMVSGRDYCVGIDTMPATCNSIASSYIPYTYPHPERNEAQRTIPTPPAGLKVVAP